MLGARLINCQPRTHPLRPPLPRSPQLHATTLQLRARHDALLISALAAPALPDRGAAPLRYRVSTGAVVSAAAARSSGVDVRDASAPSLPTSRCRRGARASSAVAALGGDRLASLP